MHMSGSAALGLGIALVLVAPATAQAAAQQDNKIQGYISVGTGLLPDYEGSNAYELTPYLEGEAAKGNYFVRFEGGALQLNLWNNEHFHAGPLIGYRLGRGEVESNNVARMAHIKYSVTAGGFLEYEHVAEDPRSGERVTLSVDDGTFNEQTGWSAVLRASVNRPVTFMNPGLIASLEADATWADGKYMQSYFGVDGADALASGLPLYHASSGLESAGVGFSLDQFLSRKWSVGLRLHYARLTGVAADSPVTTVAGSPNQFFGGLVIGYVL
jgi:outer membrane scaffolding protein for murein synthesis (MipA/OmpV family)